MLITIGTSVEGSRESEFGQFLPHAPDPESDGWDRFVDIMMEPACHEIQCDIFITIQTVAIATW